MTVSSTPAPWFGGKWEMGWLIERFPPSATIHTYVEPYGGMAGLLLQKQPSPVEVYNDVNSMLVAFWRALRLYSDELVTALELTPVSYEEWYRAGKTLKDLGEPPDDKETVIELARQFIVMARQSMAGAPGRAFQAVITHSRRGMASNCSAWRNMPDIIRECGDRMSSVQIEHRPALFVIKKYDTPKTLFYVDPPYWPTTCQTGIYKNAGGAEMSQAEHALLIRCLRDVKGSVVLSGYGTEFYDKWLVDRSGWDKFTKEVPCRSAVSPSGSVSPQKTRKEIVWAKYADGMKPDSAKGLFESQGLTPAVCRTN